jgi:exodeoxyribonuclease VII small subunit
MAGRKKAADDKTSFDQGMNALEQIVAELESGDLPLEKALEAYEKGVGLVRGLNDRLTEAEKKIEILSRGRDGSLEVGVLDQDDERE